MPLALGGENIDGLTLTLQPGYKVSGRVEFVGAAERPPAQRLAQIPVMVEAADSRQRSNFQQPGRLNADGTFTVGGLLPGKYLVPDRRCARRLVAAVGHVQRRRRRGPSVRPGRS